MLRNIAAGTMTFRAAEVPSDAAPLLLFPLATRTPPAALVATAASSMAAELLARVTLSSAGAELIRLRPVVLTTVELAGGGEMLVRVAIASTAEPLVGNWPGTSEWVEALK